MIHQILVIFDSKVQAFATPFFVRSQAEGIRSLVANLSDPESLLHKFPEDYSLYSLGTFDDETGILEQKLPVNLGLVSVFKPKEV